MRDPRQNPDQGRILLAIILTMGIVLAWELFFAPPRDAPPPPAQTESETPAPPRFSQKAGAPVIPIRTPKLRGAISLLGARIDRLDLTAYRQTVDEGSPAVTLFQPLRAEDGNGYFAEIGWRNLNPSAPVALPSPRSLWKAQPNAELTPETPVTITYQNRDGWLFSIRIEVDEGYMLRVTQSVRAPASAPASDETPQLAPDLRLIRAGAFETLDYFLLHEGFIGYFSEEGLEEHDYDDPEPDAPSLFRSEGGWLGITDKYWAAVLIPESDSEMAGRFQNLGEEDAPIYEAGFHLTKPPPHAEPTTTRLFAGAKEVARLEAYARADIPRFDLLIDWGWFYFLTKPVFVGLDFFYQRIGDFGLAILMLTVVIKLLFFPLSNTAYRTISQMRKLQPEIERIQKAHQEDWTRRNEEMMRLYQKHELRPLNGCLPMALQAPVFFALYKVLFITIEMRHVPFYGWIQDLSVPDPTSLFNLFGLLPYSVPPLLTIGLWPILMGATLFIQLRMNPPPPHPIQKTIMDWIPVVLIVVLAQFPAGLVIYWVWNNILSIGQQAIMMRRHGVPIALFENLFSKRSKKEGS